MHSLYIVSLFCEIHIMKSIKSFKFLFPESIWGQRICEHNICKDLRIHHKISFFLAAMLKFIMHNFVTLWVISSTTVLVRLHHAFLSTRSQIHVVLLWYHRKTSQLFIMICLVHTVSVDVRCGLFFFEWVWLLAFSHSFVPVSRT